MPGQACGFLSRPLTAPGRTANVMYVFMRSGPSKTFSPLRSRHVRSLIDFQSRRGGGLCSDLHLVGRVNGEEVLAPLVVTLDANGLVSCASTGTEDTWSVKTDDRSDTIDHIRRHNAPPQWSTETRKKKTEYRLHIHRVYYTYGIAVSISTGHV